MLTLVTGGTGLVGNNVVRLLLERGERVRVLARQTSASRPLEGLDIETVRGDVRDAESLRSAMQGVDLVIHTAAHVHIGWTGMGLQQAINVGGTRNVAAAARAASARMVHVSSVDALGLGTRQLPADEETPPEGSVPCTYIVTKRAAEVTLLDEVARGLHAVIVNPCYMLGPWDWRPSSGRMLLEVSKGWALLAPPGGNNFCDVRDVAAGILLAAERGSPGRRYILGGDALSYFEAWTMMAEVTGSRKPLRTARRLPLAVAGKAGDLWAKLTGREGDVNSAATAMSQLPHYFSSARAEAELGYRPRPAREAAEAAWKWFVEYGYASVRTKAAS